jgi:anti-sigma B factor antagonist
LPARRRATATFPRTANQTPVNEISGKFYFCGRSLDKARRLYYSKYTIMELKIRKNAEIYIIDVLGEMDLYNSYKLKELIMKMIEKKIERFIINLEDVEYIDSSGIGALIYITSTIKKVNLKLAITNVHGSVKKVIELTKLSGFFPILQTMEEAIRAMEA